MSSNAVFPNKSVISGPFEVGIPGVILPNIIEELPPTPVVIFNQMQFSYNEPANIVASTGNSAYLIYVGTSYVTVQISGKAYACECNDPMCARAHGMDEVLDFFQNFMPSKNGPVEVTVGFAGSQYKGYLVSFNGSAQTNATEEAYSFVIGIATHMDNRQAYVISGSESGSGGSFLR